MSKGRKNIDDRWCGEKSQQIGILNPSYLPFIRDLACARPSLSRSAKNNFVLEILWNSRTAKERKNTTQVSSMWWTFQPALNLSSVKKIVLPLANASVWRENLSYEVKRNMQVIRVLVVDRIWTLFQTDDEEGSDKRYRERKFHGWVSLVIVVGEWDWPRHCGFCDASRL